jgi:HD-GYP domain-containing protein (c-di-GMP phosphodiesterase class II)
VARYARLTAARLSESAELRSACCYGGLLHDVGKIGVSDGVLNKPGQLLPEEWDLMRSHVRVGRDLLANVPALGGVGDVVHHHHERWDGQGYPDGLRGEDIPLAARVVCVADAFCAMTAKRAYRESLSEEEARQELVRCKGSHFDPRVVDALLAVLDDPDARRQCPDGCELPPHTAHRGEFRHVLRPGRSSKDGAG